MGWDWVGLEISVGTDCKSTTLLNKLLQNFLAQTLSALLNSIRAFGI